MTRILGTKQNKPKRIETIAFMREIADRMFLPEETVQAIWEASTAIIVEALLRNEEVVIRRFGVFRLNRTGAARFRAATALRKMLKENTMEKYGVEMENEAVLLAKVTGECPSCKTPLESKDPPCCSKCGTAPFEKAPRSNSMNRAFGTLYGKKPDEEE